MDYQPQYDHRKHYKLGDITHFGGCEYECVDEENQYFVNNTYIPRPPKVKSPGLVGEDSLKVPEIVYDFNAEPVPPARVTRDGITFNAPAPIFIFSMSIVAITSALIGAYFG